jgi:hypothetical protein
MLAARRRRDCGRLLPGTAPRARNAPGTRPAATGRVARLGRHGREFAGLEIGEQPEQDLDQLQKRGLYRPVQRILRSPSGNRRAQVLQGVAAAVGGDG